MTLIPPGCYIVAVRFQQIKIKGLFLVIEPKNERGLRHWADELQRRNIPAIMLADEYTLKHHLDLLKKIAGAGLEVGISFNSDFRKGF